MHVCSESNRRAVDLRFVFVVLPIMIEIGLGEMVYTFFSFLNDMEEFLRFSFKHFFL